MRYILIFVLLFFLCTENRGAVPRMITQHYTTDDGLAHNIVNCTLKDSDGWIWFGTWYGLCRFDGLRFKEYNNRDEFFMDIPPRKIQMILEDKSKNLWIKTIDHKLYLFNKRKETFHSVFNVLKSKISVSSQIIKIQKTEEGEILLLTKEKDLLRAVSNGKGEIDIELLHHANRADGHTIFRNTLCETATSLNWIGNDYKLFSFRKGKLLEQKPEDFLLQKMGHTQQTGFSCATAEGDYLWVGGEDGQAWRINYITGEVNQYILADKGRKITSLAVDSKYIYAALHGKGMVQYDIRNGKIKELPLAVRGENVLDIYFDSYDKLWLEETGDVMRFYDPLNKREKVFHFESGKVQKRFILQDGRGNGLYILTPAGDVYRFDRENMKMEFLNESLERVDGKGRVPFFDIFLDRDGILWLSSVNAGVYQMIFPKQQFLWYVPDGKQVFPGGTERTNSVKAMLQTRNGDIWLGTRRGEVYRLDENKQVKQLFDVETFRIGNVYHMMEDRSGRLWFSTKGDGLVCGTPDAGAEYGYRFTRFMRDEKDGQSISGKDVYYSYQDSRGRIWIGLFGGGLNLVEEKDGKIIFRHKYNCFKNYPPYGLYLEVRNIIEDKDGRIWVGTTDGLLSFDGEFSDPEEICFDTYRKDIPFNNIADNDIYAMHMGKDSCIWIGVFGGGLNRLVSYDTVSGLPVFESFGLKEGLATDVILSITSDDADHLWLGTEAGLTCFHISGQTFRNFDKYDGWPGLKLEEECMIPCESGEIWVGCTAGFLTFRPEELTTYHPLYKTYVVDFKVSNRDIRSFREKPIIYEAVKDTKALTLNYDQSMFTLEFAALNYYNQHKISYKYLLEGYEKEWHLNGRNRIASYINVPPGKYLFKVLAINEANPRYPSEQTLKITILPPWWKTTWAYTIYALLSLLLAIVTLRFVLFMIRIKNDVYINQKLAELKIKFFTNISHELRTPLTLIEGPIHELKEKEKLSVKGRQYVELMEKSTHHMLQLVNQILDFRKIENGKMRLHVSKVDMQALVDSFSGEFRMLAEEKRISYNAEVTGENLFVWGDPEKLEIVVRNILSNAFKFTPEEGSIFLSAGLAEYKKQYYIRIEDTGVGIPQNKLSEIFERFSQGDNIRNMSYQGTGIGLALAKEIVNLHHGQIVVESKLQEGSVFTIYLPVGKEHFKAEEVDFYVGDAPLDTELENDSVNNQEEYEEGGNSSLPVLLVVEDNKDLCQLIKMQMDDKFRVYTAENGVAGLKKVHLYHPDIVVTDQMMPEMDGLEMLQQIRKDFRISHIPVIILTAKNDDEAKTKAISMGANAYITKPFSKEYLLARIEQLLNERKLFRENVWKTVGKEEQQEMDYEHYLVKRDRELLDKIHQVIEANLDNSDFNIDTIASTIGLSRSAFFKKLKSLTGLAPVDLVKEIRLNKSVELIKNTDLTITEIAFAVGFKDSGYYGKCFRKKYLQTPREFMAEYRKA